MSSDRKGRVINKRPLYDWSIWNHWQVNQTEDVVRPENLEVQTKFHDPKNVDPHHGNWVQFLPSPELHQQANEICQYLIGNPSVGPITYEAFKKNTKKPLQLL